jgi:hypothetical protein
MPPVYKEVDKALVGSNPTAGADSPRKKIYIGVPAILKNPFLLMVVAHSSASFSQPQ